MTTHNLDPTSQGGAAPSTPEAMLSDRAGDVLGVREGGEAAPPPSGLEQAIMALDGDAAGARGPAGAAETAAVRQGEHHAGQTAAGSRRRREILDAARALIAERGYRGTSLRDISARVGISHPGMLHHFPAKEALLNALLDELESHAQGTIDTMADFDASSAALEALVHHDFVDEVERVVLFAVLTTEAINPDYPSRLRIIRLRRAYEHISGAIIAEAKKRGEAAEWVDPEWAGRTIISLAIAVATREATIGDVQPSAAGLAISDYLAFIDLLRA